VNFAQGIISQTALRGEGRMSQDYWSESFKNLINQRFNELAGAALLVEER
jgi:hypothetical protein